MYWLASDQQSIQTPTEGHFHSLHTHLRHLNPNVKGLENFSWDRSSFINDAAFAKDAFLAIGQEGDVLFMKGRRANIYHGLEPYGVVQSHRPTSYIRESVLDLNARALPPWQIFHLIFARKASPRMENQLRAAGLDPEDHFTIYFIPRELEFAVGLKIPLLGITLPKKMMNSAETDKSNRLEPDLLDFSRAQFVTMDEAMALAHSQQDSSYLLQAGLHIPFHSKAPEPWRGKTFKIRLDQLVHLNRVLYRTYLAAVGLSNSRNFEELKKAGVSELTENIAATSFQSFQELDGTNQTLNILLEEVLSSPPVVPQEGRARDLGLSIFGPGSRLMRGAVRFASWMNQVIDAQEKKLGQEPGESDEAARQEYQRFIHNFREALKKLNRARSSDIWGLQASNPNIMHLDRHQPAAESKAGERLRSTMTLAILCALPAATLTMVGSLGSILYEHAGQILPYAGFAIGVGGLTAAAFTVASYLRNVTIRDARRTRQLYDDVDPRSQSLLIRADEAHLAGEEPAPPRTADRLTEAESMRSRLRTESGFFHRLGLRARLGLVSLRDRVNPLERRVRRIQEMPQPPQELLPLELFASSMRWVLKASLLPWHRVAIKIVCPYAFDSWEKGGNLSWEDWGLRPRGWYTLARIATLPLSFVGEGRTINVDGREYPLNRYDEYWILSEKARDVARGKYSTVGPAIDRAVKRLSIAKALQLGIHPALVPSIFSVETHFDEEGLSWLMGLRSRLPVEHRPSVQTLEELHEYLKKLRRAAAEASLEEYMMARSTVAYRTTIQTPQGEERRLRWEERVLVLSAEAQSKISEALNENTTPSPEAFRQIRTAWTDRWLRYEANFRNRFGRIGKNAENMTQGVAWETLGNWIPTLLIERAIISAQVIPPMMERSFHVGMSEADFYNGLAPLFVFSGPENLFQFANSLAASSTFIDQLLDETARNRNLGYWGRFFGTAKHLPIRNILLQSAAVWDTRILSATNSALVMAGFMFGTDLLIRGGAEGITSATALGFFQKRTSNFAATAIFNTGFGIASIPTYRVLYLLRRGAGGISYRRHTNPGEETKNPHRFADQLVSVGVNLGLNTVYGLSAGTVIPDLSEGIHRGLTRTIDSCAASLPLISNVPPEVPDPAAASHHHP